MASKQTNDSESAKTSKSKAPVIEIDFDDVPTSTPAPAPTPKKQSSSLVWSPSELTDEHVFRKTSDIINEPGDSLRLVLSLILRSDTKSSHDMEEDVTTFRELKRKVRSNMEGKESVWVDNDEQDDVYVLIELFKKMFRKYNIYATVNKQVDDKDIVNKHIFLFVPTPAPVSAPVPAPVTKPSRVQSLTQTKRPVPPAPAFSAKTTLDQEIHDLLNEADNQLSYTLPAPSPQKKRSAPTVIEDLEPHPGKKSKTAEPSNGNAVHTVSAPVPTAPIGTKSQRDIIKVINDDELARANVGKKLLADLEDIRRETTSEKVRLDWAMKKLTAYFANGDEADRDLLTHLRTQPRN
jgi:hypothetical protein